MPLTDPRIGFAGESALAAVGADHDAREGGSRPSVPASTSPEAGVQMASVLGGLAELELEVLQAGLKRLIDGDWGHRSIVEAYEGLNALLALSTPPDGAGPSSEQDGPVGREGSVDSKEEEPTAVSRLAALPGLAIDGAQSKSLGPTQLFAKAARAHHLSMRELLHTFAASAAGAWVLYMLGAGAVEVDGHWLETAPV